MDRMTRHRLAKQRAKIKNLVTEAHHKIALDMSRRWDTLVLPPFETHGMTKKRQRQGGARKINTKTTRQLLSWRSYEFSVHAKNVFLRAGRELCSPDERYTTMACGKCGTLGEKHSKEEWKCAYCGAFHQRDPAAARCIFIKCFTPPSASTTNSSANGGDCGEIQPTNVPTTTRYDPSGDAEAGTIQ